MSELVFTPASILDLLVQIDELKDYNISLSQPDNDTAYLTIGDSTDIGSRLENRSSNLGEKIKDLKGGKINGKLASELQL